MEKITNIKIKNVTYELYKCHYVLWEIFKDYHYQPNLNVCADCYVLKYGNEMVGFFSTLQLPVKNKKAKRAHRTVILPKFQCRGIASTLTNFFANFYSLQGYSYYTKTSNKILGEYRNRSGLWKATSHNMKVRSEKELSKCNITNSSKEIIGYCHVWVG